MRRVRSFRLLAVAVAAGSMMAVPLAGPASALTGTTCSSGKIVFSTKTFTATSPLTNCTNPAATGGKGTGVLNFKVVTAITGKITWNKTGTTTLKISSKAGSAAQNAVCVKAVGAGATANVATGTVTGGTGAALKGIPKGSKYSETLCISKAVTLSLYPGSKVVV